MLLLRTLLIFAGGCWVPRARFRARLPAHGQAASEPL